MVRPHNPQRRRRPRFLQRGRRLVRHAHRYGRLLRLRDAPARLKGRRRRHLPRPRGERRSPAAVVDLHHRAQPRQEPEGLRCPGRLDYPPREIDGRGPHGGRARSRRRRRRAVSAGASHAAGKTETVGGRGRRRHLTVRHPARPAKHWRPGRAAPAPTNPRPRAPAPSASPAMAPPPDRSRAKPRPHTARNSARAGRR